MKPIKMNGVSAPITISQAYDKFITYAKLKNYSPDTIEYYDNNIHVFSNFHSLEHPVTTLTTELMESYSSHLLNANLRTYTVYSYLKAMRALTNYFHSCGLIEKVHYTMPTVDQEVKEIYSEDELSALLRKPDLKKCSFPEYRNWVIVNYLLGTGQRLDSVVNLKFEDIDFESGVVKLTRTKGRRQLLMPLSKSLLDVLKEYQTYRLGETGEWFFCKEDGGQLKKQTLKEAIAIYNKRRGVNKTSIHLFRHTFATKYLLNGGDVFKLQRLLGHKSIKSTMIYLNLVISDLQAGYEDVNPLDKLVRGEKL